MRKNNVEGIVAWGMGLFGFIMLLLILFGIGLSLYGLYLAFSASIILGILAFVVEPSPLVFGIAMFFFDKDLPQLIMNFLTS